MRHRKPIAALVAAFLVLSACSGGHRTSETSGFTDTPTAGSDPVDLPIFYDVPDPLPPGQPGDIIKTATILQNPLGRMLRVMYHSRSVAGDDIAVTGVIAIPATSPPDGGYPVIAWDHGTTGLADKCAPSLSINSIAAVAAGVVSTGNVLAATDYEGMGTPGLHPYLVGESEARSTLDIVRAAHNLASAHASERFVVWGGSQGGHAAIYAMQAAARWAPELELLGGVASAPPSDLQAIDAAARGGGIKGVLLMIAAGFNAAYGDAVAPLTADLTADGAARLKTLDRVCAKDFESATAKVDLGTLESTDPLTSPAWQKVLDDNDPTRITSPVAAPLLIIQGTDDEVVPVATTATLYDHLCAIGQATQRWMYPGQAHAEAIGVSATDALRWLQERIDGTDVGKGKDPSGVPDVQTQRCP